MENIKTKHVVFVSQFAALINADLRLKCVPQLPYQRNNQTSQNQTENTTIFPHKTQHFEKLFKRGLKEMVGR